ncbi:MAG TPA: tetratricopeptide repeat protein, partial [Thermoanaerobaculia bacterium]|nr:tetratricopeptide repeat protein [Thermoanaerobaculia bacterium]
ADAWNQLGMSLEMTGRYEDAAAAYRQAIEKTPELAGEFGLLLGSVLLRMERFDEAEKHAKLGEKTNFGGSHVLLARIQLARKHFAEAEREAHIAEGDKFSQVTARVLLAQVYAQQDRAKEAYVITEEVAAEAEQRKLGNIESLDFVRGDALARMARYPEAIDALRREIEHFPHNRQAYASLYLVYMLTNRPDDANGLLELMVRVNPNKRAALFAAHTVEAIGDQRGAAMWRQRAATLR